MMFWTAFLLGLAGSIHCAGMCGPLALALPLTGGGGGAFILGRLAYNMGRLGTYVALGAVLGSLGKAFEVAGAQRWLSICLGAALFLGLAASRKHGLGTPLVHSVARLKHILGFLLKRRSLSSLLLLGLLNGLLPCGLVYAACTTAAATRGPLEGAASMCCFGLGTLPTMLGLAFFGRLIHAPLRLRLQRLAPVAVLALGVLLILRGLSLGIPHFSPDASQATSANQCH